MSALARLHMIVTVLAGVALCIGIVHAPRTTHMLSAEALTAEVFLRASAIMAMLSSVVGIALLAAYRGRVGRRLALSVMLALLILLMSVSLM